MPSSKRHLIGWLQKRKTAGRTNVDRASRVVELADETSLTLGFRSLTSETFDRQSLIGVEADQRTVCERFGVAFEPPSIFEKVGIALSTLHLKPLNGLRHRPERGTSGICGVAVSCRRPPTSSRLFTFITSANAVPPSYRIWPFRQATDF